jgi:RNA polymerase II subunit A-like phosphatase
MSSPSSLHLSPNLPFPIKIASLDIQPPSQVTRGTRLLTYSFVYVPSSQDDSPETRFGIWDCSVEGTIHAWKLKVGDVITEKRARERPAVEVIEPCTHGVQIGGLCGLCGKDMTE